MTQTDLHKNKSIHWDSLASESSYQRSDSFYRSSPHLPALMQRGGSPWSIGQFILHEQIYKGKSSRVYMATDKLSLLQVVIKYYKKDKLTPLNKYQVEREIDIHLGLHHQNIIMLYAAFEDESNVYMVLEKAHTDLFQRNEFALSSSRKLLEQKTAVNVIAPFLTVLNYLHDKGIIHRDIKPENILMMEDNTLKLADFGLAIDMNAERPVTRTGTLDYMAPEVLRCPDKTSPEQYKEKVELAYTSLVDVWAVGILAYELLAGQAPFEKESRIETYHNILSGEPEFPPWLSPGAVSFIKIALCKDPNNRPTSEKLHRHPWVQSFFSSRQNFRSSTGGIRHETPMAQILPLSSKDTPSVSAATTPIVPLPDAVQIGSTAQEVKVCEKNKRHMSTPGYSKPEHKENPSDDTREWDSAVQDLISFEKLSTGSIQGRSVSGARNGSFLETLASAASGSKLHRPSNSGSSPSPSNPSPLAHHMTSQASTNVSPRSSNSKLESPSMGHPPPLMHLHSLQHQHHHAPMPPHSPQSLSSRGIGPCTSRRPPPIHPPTSILESMPGSSKPSFSGSSITHSGSLAANGDRTSPTSGPLTNLHPLHRMKLQVQINSEPSQSNSEGLATPLSTPGSMPTPTAGPLSTLGLPHQKRTSPQGSARGPSVSKSHSMGHKSLEGQSTSLNAIQFGNKSSATTPNAAGSPATWSLLGAALDRGVTGVQDGAGQSHEQSDAQFQPLRRRSSLPGVPRISLSGNANLTPLSSQIMQLQRQAHSQSGSEPPSPVSAPLALAVTPGDGSKAKTSIRRPSPAITSHASPGNSASSTARIHHQGEQFLPSLSRQGSSSQPSPSAHASSTKHSSLLNLSSLSLASATAAGHGEEGKISPDGTMYKGTKLTSDC